MKKNKNRLLTSTHFEAHVGNHEPATGTNADEKRGNVLHATATAFETIAQVHTVAQLRAQYLDQAHWPPEQVAGNSLSPLISRLSGTQRAIKTSIVLLPISIAARMAVFCCCIKDSLNIS